MNDRKKCVLFNILYETKRTAKRNRESSFLFHTHTQLFFSTVCTHICTDIREMNCNWRSRKSCRQVQSIIPSRETFVKRIRACLFSRFSLDCSSPFRTYLHTSFSSFDQLIIRIFTISLPISILLVIDYNNKQNKIKNNYIFIK